MNMADYNMYINEDPNARIVYVMQLDKKKKAMLPTMSVMEPTWGHWMPISK
jgi:hypothetical protein